MCASRGQLAGPAQLCFLAACCAGAVVLGTIRQFFLLYTTAACCAARLSECEGWQDQGNVLQAGNVISGAQGESSRAEG